MAKDYSQERLAAAYQEADIATWQQQAQKYRAAWETEKTVSRAHLEGWRTAQVQLEEAKSGKLAALLMGVYLGIITGLIIAGITSAFLR